MSALVLYWDVWPFRGQARALADAVASSLGARATALDKRPHLGIYELIVVVAPAVALLDPRLQLMAADGELRGKTAALLTDAGGPWPDGFTEPWRALASALGGARIFEAPLHLGPWLPQAAWPDADGLVPDPALCERAAAWGKRLAVDFPPPVYPRGEAGRRQM